MPRMPAFGTAVMFVATLVVTLPVAADPISIEAGRSLAGGRRATSLTALEHSFPYLGRSQAEGRVDRAPLGGGWYHISDRSAADFLISRGNGVSFGEFRGGSSSMPSGSTASGGSQQRHESKKGSGGSSGSSSGPAFSGSSSSSSSNSFQPSPPSLLPTPHLPAGVVTTLPAAAGGQASSGRPSAVPTAITDFAGAESVVTPEPASILLFGSGLALAALRARRTRQRQNQR